jgi:hypothetical protein
MNRNEAKVRHKGYKLIVKLGENKVILMIPSIVRYYFYGYKS